MFYAPFITACIAVNADVTNGHILPSGKMNHMQLWEHTPLLSKSPFLAHALDVHMVYCKMRNSADSKKGTKKAAKSKPQYVKIKN